MKERFTKAIEAEGGKKRRPVEAAPVAAAPVAEKAPEKPVEQVVVQKVIRELNDADRAKMAELTADNINEDAMLRSILAPAKERV